MLIATLHEGAPVGTPTPRLEQNMAASPVFANIVNDTSPEVAAIVTGHTHQAYAYQAPVPGQPGATRPIIQTGNYGANVGQITLTRRPGHRRGHRLAPSENVPRTTTADADLIAPTRASRPINATVDGGAGQRRRPSATSRSAR